MKKMIQKLTFKHWKWRKDNNFKIFENDYIVLFDDGTYKQCNKTEVIYCLKKQNSKPIRYIVEKADIMYIDEDIEVIEGKEDENEVSIIKADDSAV